MRRSLCGCCFAHCSDGVRCEQSRVSVDYVLNIRAFNLKELLIAEPTFLREPARTKHDKSISSIGINVAGDVDLEAMQGWIGSLLEGKASDMYRMKGILAVDGSTIAITVIGHNYYRPYLL